jgi:hypothetical protein
MPYKNPKSSPVVSFKAAPYIFFSASTSFALDGLPLISFGPPLSQLFRDLLWALPLGFEADNAAPSIVFRSLCSCRVKEVDMSGDTWLVLPSLSSLPPNFTARQPSKRCARATYRVDNRTSQQRSQVPPGTLCTNT